MYSIFTINSVFYTYLKVNTEEEVEVIGGGDAEIDMVVGDDTGEDSVEDAGVQHFSRRLFGSNLNNRCHGVVS